MDIQTLLGKTDIYIIDQIMKARYQTGQSILDAGCGGGRNLTYFYQHNFDLHAVDVSAKRIAEAQQLYPRIASHLQVADLVALPYPDERFDHLICSAVLHFAKNTSHFMQQLGELLRVLKTGGTLFIRMASTFGVPDQTFQYLGEGRYHLKDGSDRFLLTPTLLQEMLSTYNLSFLELLKTTNVNGLRCMTTLVLKKG